MDDLAIMQDDEIINRLRSLDSSREQVVMMGLDPRPWEEELAYVRREISIRKQRADIHDRYISEIERENIISARSEASLPPADLDNSAFMEIR